MILTLSLVVAGFAAILGFGKLAGKIFGITIAAALLLSLIATMQARCPGNSLIIWLVAAIVLIALLYLLIKGKGLFTLLWWLVKNIVLINYKLGLWLTERYLLRFPVALLPAIPRDLLPPILRYLVQLACSGIGVSVFVVLADVGYRLSSKPPLLTGNAWLWLSIPLAVILVFGNIGKLIYRQREKKGLSNV